MTALVLPFGVLAASALLARLFTGHTIVYLRRRAVLDRPNERSSHTVPTPRGGGLAVMAVVLPAWAVVGFVQGVNPVFWAAASGALALAAVSWVDDRGGLSPAVRLFLHILAVTAALAALPEDALVLQGWLPVWADRTATAVAWVWFINLFNFMDGIDGIAGSETVMVALGVALISALETGSASAMPILPALALAGAAFGFLTWNWHPARVFLGDVGSVPIGFLLGFLLIETATAGHLAAAVILPAYFLADATLTLLRRLTRGEKIWRPHREHFYQRAVQCGRRHDKVVRAVITANLALIAMAAASLTISAALALGGATVVVAALLLHLASRPRRVPEPE